MIVDHHQFEKVRACDVQIPWVAPAPVYKMYNERTWRSSSLSMLPSSDTVCSAPHLHAPSTSRLRAQDSRRSLDSVRRPMFFIYRTVRRSSTRTFAFPVQRGAVWHTDEHPGCLYLQGGERARRVAAGVPANHRELYYGEEDIVARAFQRAACRQTDAAGRRDAEAGRPPHEHVGRRRTKGCEGSCETR